MVSGVIALLFTLLSGGLGGMGVERMSSMMRRMSGLIDRPSMRDAEARKQIDAMRSEMTAMQKQHQ